MPHGDDFRYSSQNDWNNQFDNLGKLMEFINNSTDMNMKVCIPTAEVMFYKINSQYHNSDFLTLKTKY